MLRGRGKLCPYNHEPSPGKENSSSANLSKQLLRTEVSLVDLPSGAVVEDSILPGGGGHTLANGGIHDDKLARDAPRFGKKSEPRLLFELSVEVPC